MTKDSEEEGSWTYQEIFDCVLENGSVTMTVDRVLVDQIKKGIVNCKQATRKRALYKGIPWEPISLVFTTKECEDKAEREFYIDLEVSISKKARITLKRVKTPEPYNLEDE